MLSVLPSDDNRKDAGANVVNSGQDLAWVSSWAEKAEKQIQSLFLDLRLRIGEDPCSSGQELERIAIAHSSSATLSRVVSPGCHGSAILPDFEQAVPRPPNHDPWVVASVPAPPPQIGSSIMSEGVHEEKQTFQKSDFDGPSSEERKSRPSSPSSQRSSPSPKINRPNSMAMQPANSVKLALPKDSDKPEAVIRIHSPYECDVEALDVPARTSGPFSQSQNLVDHQVVEALLVGDCDKTSSPHDDDDDSLDESLDSALKSPPMTSMSFISATSAQRLNQQSEWKKHMADHIQNALAVNNFFGIYLTKLASSENAFKHLLNTKIFMGACTVLIVANAVFIGIDTHVEMRDKLRGSVDETAEDVLRYFNIFFCVAFTVEILCRLLAHRIGFFFGDEKGWNYFDLFLVVTSIIDISVGSQTFRSFSILRGLRLVRVLRVIRLMRFFRDLRRMLSSILHSLAALSWALVLLVIIMYLFAIVFMQAATQIVARGEAQDATVMSIERFYGTMHYTMLTLLMSITGGLDWNEPSELLDDSQEGFAYRMLFAAYVTFVVIGVLNVLTGIFVERACELSGVDRDLLVRAEMNKQNSFVLQMRQIFEEADTDGSGVICWEEFREYLRNDKIKAYLATQQLDAFDAQQLWVLLSSNEDGEKTDDVDITTFIMGCLRLRGQAKSVDVAAMLSEQRHFKGKFNDFKRNLDVTLGDLSAHVEELKEQMESKRGNAGGGLAASSTIRRGSMRRPSRKNSISQDFAGKLPGSRRSSFAFQRAVSDGAMLKKRSGEADEAWMKEEGEEDS